MALPLIIAGVTLVVGVVGLVIGKEGVTAAKKGNSIGIVGVLVGAVTSIIMIWAFMPESEEEFDIKNYYADGVLHFTGNGSVEDKEGTWSWYSKDGIVIKLETYDDNELDGKYQEFYENGNLKIQGEYNDGEKDNDEWKCFNLDGSSKKCNDV